MKKIHFTLIFIACIFAATYFAYTCSLKVNLNPSRVIGQKLDSLNGVYVYYNGGIGHVLSRNVSPDGYNLGLKYQCVEFVKRYYYQHYNHKMPDSYGHAKDFFNKEVADGTLNKPRNLRQYTNPSFSRPKIGDLIIFDGHPANIYGHVAIISQVLSDKIQIIQQNPGPYEDSRIWIPMLPGKGKYLIDENGVLGWLRK